MKGENEYGIYKQFISRICEIESELFRVESKENWQDHAALCCGAVYGRALLGEWESLCEADRALYGYLQEEWKKEALRFADKNPEYTMFDWNGKVVYKARGFDGAEKGSTKGWGRLKSGAGFISLDYIGQVKNPYCYRSHEES